MEVGDHVLVAGQKNGIVRFYGKTDFAPGPPASPHRVLLTASSVNPEPKSWSAALTPKSNLKFNTVSKYNHKSIKTASKVLHYFIIKTSCGCRNDTTGHEALWRNGQRIGLLVAGEVIQRLWVRVPPESSFINNLNSQFILKSVLIQQTVQDSATREGSSLNDGIFQ